jgi:ribosomal protein S18 acetylase RimI-like enzyme
MSAALASETDLVSAAVRFLGPADWAVLRSARLEAVRNAPEAFVTTFLAEPMRPPEEWIEILRSSTWVAAWQDGELAGVACLAAEDDEGPTRRFVESVWVVPHRRRRGLVRRMLQQLQDRAAKEGATYLQLWVLATNETAADAYLKLKFDWVPHRVQWSPKQSVDGIPVKERLMERPIFA